MGCTRDCDCTRCPLHEGVTTVCVPTVWHHPAGPGFATRETRSHERAILIVGEAPGLNEDRAGLPFVGKSGRLLREVYIDHFKLPSLADVYLSNAVRCRLPHGKKGPTKTWLKACQGFLLSDVRKLQEVYDEVIILATGSPAVESLLNTSLTKALSRQGEFTDFKELTASTQKKFGPIRRDIVGDDEWPQPCRVFATYHPAYVLRNPTGGLAVQSHLKMLVDHLNGDLDFKIKEGQLEIQLAPLPPTYPLGRLSLDLETYGFFKDCPAQHHFHPAKMERYDGITRDRITQTCGLTWKDPSGDEHHAIFVMGLAAHRRRLWAWLKKIRHEKDFEFLVGQNITYDLVVLRHCYPECRVWLEHPLPIMDTIITNYLHDETRPERSLKNLAPLFRITKYEEKISDKPYENAHDPAAWQYNCQDTYATLLLQETLENEIRSFYGSDTQKLSPFCMSWYSELLWLVIWMTETGVALSERRLRKLLAAAELRRDRIVSRAQTEWSMPLSGKGSETAKRDALAEALAQCEDFGIAKPALVLTDARKQVSFNLENRNALLEVLPHDCGAAQKLITLGEYQDISKLLDSYLYPILVGRGKGHSDQSTCVIDGIVYPKWFPVPSEYEDGKTGGTKQARFACSGPSIPTFPHNVKHAIWSRFLGGYLVWFDYSQIELRVAALLSGDEAMLEEYAQGVDRHRKTAQLIFGDDIVNHPEFKSKYRQGGKTLNFLVLYRGGALKFQETLMKQFGILYPLEKCQAAIQAFWARYPQLIEWQESIIKTVARHGYYELPLIGQSRLFLGGNKARDKAVNEIVNLPVQAVAALIMQSAQFHVWRKCREAKMQTVVPVNIYDAADLEVPRHEIYGVRRIISSTLPNPPYYDALCQHIGRRVPIEYELKERRILAA